jgi:hypothetical protein
MFTFAIILSIAIRIIAIAFAKVAQLHSIVMFCMVPETMPEALLGILIPLTSHMIPNTDRVM